MKVLRQLTDSAFAFRGLILSPLKNRAEPESASEAKLSKMAQSPALVLLLLASAGACASAAPPSNNVPLWKPTYGATNTVDVASKRGS